MTFEPTISSPKPAVDGQAMPSAAPAYEMPPEPGTVPPVAPGAASGAIDAEPAGPVLPEGWARDHAPIAKEVFFATFRAICQAPNVYMMVKKQPPLQSLVIADDDVAARAASDAIYETCLETPWLNFMLAPENKYLERLATVGGFLFLKVQAVQLELAARRQVEAAKAGDQAGDQAPPKAKKKEPELRVVRPDDFGAEPAVPDGKPNDDAPPTDQGVTELEVSNNV